MPGAVTLAMRGHCRGAATPQTAPRRRDPQDPNRQEVSFQWWQCKDLVNAIGDHSRLRAPPSRQLTVLDNFTLSHSCRLLRQAPSVPTLGFKLDNKALPSLCCHQIWSPYHRSLLELFNLKAPRLQKLCDIVFEHFILHGASVPFLLSPG